MSNRQLFIPDRIKVGFQSREDCYTKALAYVIYYDQKGVLRKETSWEGWRDKKIEPKEFSNEPLEGFVLNKGVGGKRGSWSHDIRNEYIRVYDPRDFEIEISVANLLFILRECDCSRGKGLEGKFCYAWDKTELVLLPVNSEDYKSCKEYTSLQSKSVKAKELIPGASYVTRNQEQMVFLGKFDYHFMVNTGDGWNATPVKYLNGVQKRFVFWSDQLVGYHEKSPRGFVFLDALKSIASCVSETPVTNFAELVDKYHKTQNGTPAKRLFLENDSRSTEGERAFHFFKNDGDQFKKYVANFNHEQKTIVEAIQLERSCQIEDGVLICKPMSGIAWNHAIPENKRDRFRYVSRSSWSGVCQSNMQWLEPSRNKLMVELESGSVFELEYGSFSRR